MKHPDLVLPMELTTVIKALKRQDPRLAPIIDRSPPPDFPRRKPTIHALCSQIIGQQLSMLAADRIEERFSQLAGNEDQCHPADLLRIPPSELRSAGLSNAKVQTVYRLSETWIQNELDKIDWKKKSNEEIVSILTSVKGIGPWTAKMFLIFSLARADVLPVEDLGLKKGLQRLYGDLMLPDKELIEKRAEAWKPYRTLGTHYCWLSLKPY